MFKMARNFRPPYNIVDLSNNRINGNLYVPPTIIASISNYMKEQEPESDNDPIYDKLLELSKNKE